MTLEHVLDDDLLDIFNRIKNSPINNYTELYDRATGIDPKTYSTHQLPHYFDNQLLQVLPELKKLDIDETRTACDDYNAHQSIMSYVVPSCISTMATASFSLTMSMISAIPGVYTAAQYVNTKRSKLKHPRIQQYKLLREACEELDTAAHILLPVDKKTKHATPEDTKAVLQHHLEHTPYDNDMVKEIARCAQAPPTYTLPNVDLAILGLGVAIGGVITQRQEALLAGFTCILLNVGTIAAKAALGHYKPTQHLNTHNQANNLP